MTIAPERLSEQARQIIEDRANELTFSAISIWEVAIKRGLGRADFQVDAADLRDVLLGDGFRQLDFTAVHGLAVQTLPPIHRDPFDRALLAQARAEELALMTADAQLGRYPGVLQV
jgi:PIN domain nuclease of toxin-antitoxin system